MDDKKISDIQEFTILALDDGVYQQGLNDFEEKMKEKLWNQVKDSVVKTFDYDDERQILIEKWELNIKV